MIKTLADALAKRGYETLTQVQEAVTAPELIDSDLLVSAQTGSGKTVAFGLAIGPTILEEDGCFSRANKPLALVIAPTRELALQVKRELDWLYAGAGAIVASCVGGMDMRTERRNLERGAHIVVATPGRLRDHIQRNSIKLGSLRAIVLDEADEMLDLGFRDDLEFILGESPEDRRTLMFSATVPKMIATLAKNYQKDAVRVTAGGEERQHADIEYRALNVGQRDGENAIINVLRYYEAKNALVFCNTRAMVNRLTTRFSNRGFSVVALSGELSQNERTHALQAMRDGRARVCVATDVAARGIDLPNLELVIHADLPSNSETLLHRSGRTGRAGRKGVSTLIVPPKARRKAERLLRGAKVEANWGEAPSAESVIKRDNERLLDAPTWTEEVSETERAAVDQLVEKFSAEQLAAAFLRVNQAKQSAPEELGASTERGKPAPRTTFGPSVWFSLSIGRNDRAEAKWLLPALCKSGNISNGDIGAIRVQETETFIEITKSSLNTFTKALGKGLQLEDRGTLTLLDTPPDIANMPRPRFDGKKKKPFNKKPYDKKPYDKNSGERSSKPKWQPENNSVLNEGPDTSKKKRPKKTPAENGAEGKPAFNKNKGKRRKPSTKPRRD
ncbi:MAG: DEAD/DEAH box helicase [Rhodobacteraceae bacterium]|nr:DEAD/DEAH box helicase [Paracoccaceae bacterium]